MSALDLETCRALRIHWEQFGDKGAGPVFTTAQGARGPDGALAADNFRRVWLRALLSAGLRGSGTRRGSSRTMRRPGSLF
jgi:hypothetical protein